MTKNTIKYENLKDLLSNKAVESGDIDEEWIGEKIIADCRKYIEQGWTAAYLTLGSDVDDPAEYFMSIMKESNLFNVLFDSCY